jgi:hypothetical protein
MAGLLEPAFQLAKKKNDDSAVKLSFNVHGANSLPILSDYWHGRDMP